MRIIDAVVTEARRASEWGRVEARVALTYEAFPGGPVHRRVILTSAPERDPKGRDLRTCLVADAARLAAMTTTPDLRHEPEPQRIAA